MNTRTEMSHEIDMGNADPEIVDLGDATKETKGNIWGGEDGGIGHYF